MKKFYLLMLLFISTTVMAQTPIITMVLSGGCPGQVPKMVEFYAQGTVDFSEYTLEKSANGSSSWGVSNASLNLADLGIITDDFVYLHIDHANDDFSTQFPNATHSFATTNNVVNFNGDDGVRIVDASNNVIDQFGDEYPSGTGGTITWKHAKGYAKRNNNTGPDVSFVESNWTFYHNALIDCGGANPLYEVVTNAGSYTYATSPTINTSASTVSGFLQFVGTPSAEQSVDISGLNLTTDLQMSVTSGDYEISLTSGLGFGPSVALPFGTGTVAATPVFIRLNGAAVANPSNGELTITSAGATDAVVVLEGEISLAVPTLTVSKTSITGFSHFVGTPSEVDSFNVVGFNLTDDITVTAPANFEIADDITGAYGTTLTFTPTAGSVPSAKVYVRLNGLAMNLTQAGDITVTSTDATDLTVALTGATIDYVTSSIADVTGIDANGVGTSVGEYVILTGVLHCDNFRDVGYDLTLIDANNDGINVFNYVDVDGYSAVEGDELTIKGKIAQYNGLLQINPTTITVVSQGATLQTPTSITELDETTESQYLILDSVVLVNVETEWPSNGNVMVTDGTNNFTVRVNSSSPMVGLAIPNGPMSIIGIGKQFDSSSPFDSGYQLYPCSATSLCNIDVTTTVVDETITANATGLVYQWIDCADNAPITGETGISYTATVTGSYAVIITDGACVDTSACTLVEIVGLTDMDFAGVSVYPNPVKEVLNITNKNGTLESVEVISATGSVVYVSSVTSSNFTVNTAQLNAGVYFVNVRTANSVKTFKVIK